MFPAEFPHDSQNVFSSAAPRCFRTSLPFPDTGKHQPSFSPSTGFQTEVYGVNMKIIFILTHFNFSVSIVSVSQKRNGHDRENAV